MSNLLKSKFFLGGLIAIALLVAGSTSAFTGVQKMGSMNDQVKALQMELNAKGYIVSTTGAGSPGAESMYFGAKTKAAVMAFQAAMGLTVDGVAGPATAAALAGATTTGGTYPAGCMSMTGFSTTTGMSCASTSTLPAGCTAGAMYSSTTGMSCAGGTTTTPNGDLNGTVGTIDYALTSGYSNEEVGEGSEDVKVAGLELDLEDSDSDVAIKSVKLNFDVGTAGNDFEDYADEVSVWLGSEEVGRVDGDSFNDDNDFEKTVSLSGAIVEMGDVEDLYVAVSGVSNLDTADISDTWTVDFVSVRFEDGEGVVTTEDPTEAAVTFSFESFATSTDVELKVSEADEDINDAHVINVHATDDTDDVEILSFNLEAEGDSDLLIDALPVTITTTETTGNDPDDLIATYYLYAAGEEIGTESNPSTDVTDDSSTVVVFEDLDYTLDAGDEVEFTVKVKLYSIADVLDAGDTIAAAFGETQTDLATFEVEDESGEELADGDKTGTVTGSASEVRDVGMNVALVGTPTAVISHTGDIVGSGAGDDDQGTFEIIFDVTAFDGDIYIDGTSPTLTGAGALLDLNLTETGTHALTSATITSPSGATLTGTANADARFKVAEGETERFKVTAVVTVSVDGFASIKIGDIVYALTDVTGTTSYTFNLDDFKTGDLYMNAN